MLTVALGSITTTCCPGGGYGLVLHAPRHDVDLSGAQLDVAVVHLDGELAAQDEQELVGLRVAVPGELALCLHNPYVVIVQRGDRARSPRLLDSSEDAS